MASITRRSDASFQIRISNGYAENGKRLYYTETYYPSAKRKTAQEKEAQKYADDLEQKFRSGKDYETSQMTFKEFAETC